MTGCPWRLTLESEVPRVHQLSRATLARARGPAGSTRCHGRNVPGSACQRCRPEFTGDSALARVPALWTSCTGTHTLVSKALGVDQLSRETAGSAPSACGVDQLSRATRALVRGPPCRHGFPGDSDRARGPGYRTAVPCDSRFCPRAPGVNQRSRQHGPVCESPRGRPPVPGASGRYPRAHKVDQFSRASRFLVQGPALTSCPGRIVPGSACQRGRPDYRGTRAQA